MRLNPIKNRPSCPDCGWFEPGNDLAGIRMLPSQEMVYDCPRCKAHYSADEFWRLHHEKEMAKNHKRAEADLSDESV